MAKIYQYILDERKVMIGKNKTREKSNILLDMMLNTQDDDEGGNEFNDEKIIAMLVSYTFAGFESVGLVASTAIMYLQKYPHFLNKAKVYLYIHHYFYYSFLRLCSIRIKIFFNFLELEKISFMITSLLLCHTYSYSSSSHPLS